MTVGPHSRAITRALMCGHQRVQARQRQEHAQWLCGEGLKTIAKIQCRATVDLHSVATVENIEHRHGNSQVPARTPYAFQSIDKKVATKSLPLKLGIHANHGDERGRNLAVTGPCPAKARGQILIIDGMGVEGIIAQDIILSVRHDENAKITGLNELVGGLAQEIVDLRHAAGKSPAIMARRIKRLDPRRPLRFCIAHRLETVR